MALTPLVEQDVIDIVKRRMGHPQVVVELEEADYQDALDFALRFYSRIKPLKINRSTSNVLAGGQYIQLTDEELTDLIDVVACDYIPLFKGYQSFGGLIDQPGIIFGNYTKTGASRYLQSMQMLEMNAQTLGFDGDWVYVESDGRIYFTPPVKQVEVKYVLTKVRTVATIPYVDEDLFMKLVESYSRDKLADIRGKMKNIPSPAGEIVLDADEQRAKAESLRVEVEEKLKAERLPTPFMFG